MRSRVTRELPADFLQRARIAVAQAEAQFQDLLLAFGQAGEHIVQLVLQQTEAGHLGRAFAWTCPR